MVANATAREPVDRSRMAIQGMVTRTGWDGETWGANQKVSRWMNPSVSTHQWRV
jgi:hypothetical protein